MSDVTRLLGAMDRGDLQASSQLLPLVYDELRQVAARQLAREAAGQTLQPTALVHEAYMRLTAGDLVEAATWENRRHFFAAAAEAMRRILVEQARRRLAIKHGGGGVREPLDDSAVAAPAPDERLIEVHDVLDELAARDADAAT